MRPRVYYLTRQVHSVVIPRLEKLELEPVLFDSPREFIHAIETTPPLMCFMDLEMPTSKHGVRFFQTLQNHFRKTFPMVLFSTQIKGPIESILSQLGAVGVFPPQVDLDSLARAIAPFLNTPAIQGLTGIRLNTLSSGLEPARSVLEGNPLFDAFEISESLLSLFEIFGPKLHLLEKHFEFSRDSSERLEFYLSKLEDHTSEFMSLVQNLSRNSTEDLTDLRSCIRFFGLRSTRNWIIDHKIFNRSGGLKYALRCEEYFGEDSRYGRHAFVSGFLYDLLFHESRAHPKTHASLKNILEFTFNQSLQVCDRTYERARQKGGIEFELYLLIFQLLQPLGSLLIALKDPSYVPQIEKFLKDQMPPLLIHEWERKHFGITGNQLSATFCLFAPGLRETFFPLLLQFSQPMLAASNPSASVLLEVCQESLQNVK